VWFGVVCGNFYRSLQKQVALESKSSRDCHVQPTRVVVLCDGPSLASYAGLQARICPIYLDPLFHTPHSQCF